MPRSRAAGYFILFKVSKLLGHTSTRMTEKYAHSHIQSLRTDLKKLSLSVTRLSLGEKAVKING